MYEGIKDVNEEGARAEPKGGGIKDSNGKITEAESKGRGNEGYRTNSHPWDELVEIKEEMNQQSSEDELGERESDNESYPR